MKRHLVCSLFIALTAANLHAAPRTPQTAAPQAKPVPATKPTAGTTGDDVFKANCSRCHNPPMSISTRTTGTIIMHMRTRARLSREDEIKLLKFMAP